MNFINLYTAPCFIVKNTYLYIMISVKRLFCNLSGVYSCKSEREREGRAKEIERRKEWRIYREKERVREIETAIERERRKEWVRQRKIWKEWGREREKWTVMHCHRSSRLNEIYRPSSLSSQKNSTSLIQLYQWPLKPSTQLLPCITTYTVAGNSFLISVCLRGHISLIWTFGL